FGEAEIAALGAHHAVVVGDGQHRPGAEGVAVEGGGGRHRQGQHAPEQGVHGFDVFGGAVTVGGEPVQVEAVGVELAGRGGDQGGRAVGDDGVEVGVDLGEQVGGEAVLAGAEVEYGDRVVVAQGGHGVPFSGDRVRARHGRRPAAGRGPGDR